MGSNMTDADFQIPADQAKKDPTHALDGACVRKFRSCLSPELLLRWLVVKDGPLLPNGRFVGMATAPASYGPEEIRAAKRIVESWPAGFIVPEQTDSGQAIVPGLVFRSLILCGLARHALLTASAARCLEWVRNFETKFLTRFTLLQDTETDALSCPLLAAVPAESPAVAKHRGRLSSTARWDITLVDGTGAVPSISTLENVRERSQTLLMTADPDCGTERIFSLTQLYQRSGSFSFDAEITREYYRLVGEFERAAGKLPEHDIHFLRRAIDEISDLDPNFRDSIMDALGERKRTILKRWIRTGNCLNSSEAEAVTCALRLAAPLSRVMAGISPVVQELTAPVPDERPAVPIPAPVSMDDISKLLKDTAQQDGILHPADRPNVFAINAGSDTTLYVTASREVFAAEAGMPPASGPEAQCEFASYGGSAFDSLLALLPDMDDLPGWMRRIRVEATEGDVTVTRIAYVVSCVDGDRGILSMRALDGAVIDTGGTPAKEFVASLERYLRQVARSELAQIRRAARMEEANLRAARHQRAFALEVAAALLRQHIHPGDGSASVHDSLQTIAERQHPVLVTLNRKRLLRQSPNLFDIGQAVPDEGRMCLSIHPALLRAAVSEVSAVLPERNAEIDSKLLCQKVDQLLEMIGS